VLYLGGFDVRKNVATVLAAYRQAGSVIGDMCPLVVAGRLPEQDTPFTPDPRRLAREQGVDERFVRFIGFVEEADKPTLYQGATAFIFPSRYEGFGLPPLEALACGTPVVGSDAASILEVVGPGGVLLPPDDAKGMARALIRLATDAGFREELSRRALAQAACFSWERTARETLVAYRDVVT
jgi:glycosyltransferase involved in cell wall biosynthesis